MLTFIVTPHPLRFGVSTGKRIMFIGSVASHSSGRDQNTPRRLSQIRLFESVPTPISNMKMIWQTFYKSPSGVDRAVSARPHSPLLFDTFFHLPQSFQ